MSFGMIAFKVCRGFTNGFFCRVTKVLLVNNVRQATIGM